VWGGARAGALARRVTPLIRFQVLSGQALAFVKEDFRMFTAPSRAALPIFTDEDSKPHAGATVAVFAALTQFQHPILQFVADYPTPWWRRSNLARGRSREARTTADGYGFRLSPLSRLGWNDELV
jgi:hypothetical protein